MTLRELAAMAEARTRADWQHTAALLCLTANANRDPKRTKAYKPSDFDPTIDRHIRHDVPMPNVRMKEIKGMFAKGKK